MMDELVGLIVFDSHYLAFQTEATLKRANLDYPFRIVSAPRHLSVSCDYALEVPPDKLGQVREILEASGLTEGLSYYTV